METINPRCEVCLKSKTNRVHSANHGTHEFVPHVKHSYKFVRSFKSGGRILWTTCYLFQCKVCGFECYLSKFKFWLKPVRLPRIDMEAFKANMDLISQVGINASELRTRRG